MLYMILAGSILASLYEFKNLKKKHYVREILFSSILLTIGATLILLQIFNIDVPSPLLVIRFLFQPLSQLISGI